MEENESITFCARKWTMTAGGATRAGLTTTTRFRGQGLCSKTCYAMPGSQQAHLPRNALANCWALNCAGWCGSARGRGRAPLQWLPGAPRSSARGCSIPPSTRRVPQRVTSPTRGNGRRMVGSAKRRLPLPGRGELGREGVIVNYTE